MPLRRLPLSAAIVATAVAAAASAQQGRPAPEPRTPQEAYELCLTYIHALGHEDFKVRERATENLFAPSIPASAIEAAFSRYNRRTSCSPEQLARLELICKQRFFSATGRPAVGIRFDNQSETLGVVGEVFRGFPSRGVLKAGDVISPPEEIRFGALTPERRIGAYIFSFLPGEEAPFDVLRDGQRLTVRVKLGKWEDLPGDNPFRSYGLNDSWNIRSQRLGFSPAGRLIMLDDLVQRNEPFPKWSPPDAVAGGQPDNAASMHNRLRADLGQSSRRGVQRPQVTPMRELAESNRNAARNDLVRAIRSREVSLNHHIARLENNQLGDTAREQTETIVEKIRREIDGLSAQLAALRVDDEPND